MATIGKQIRPRPPDGDTQHQKELRRDRIIGILIVLGFLGLVALMIWLFSLNGTSPQNDSDYFDLMP